MVVLAEESPKSACEGSTGDITTSSDARISPKGGAEPRKASETSCP
jgi:hypothetical protein